MYLLFISLLKLSCCWFDFYLSMLAFRKQARWNIKCEMLHKTPQMLTAYKKRKKNSSFCCNSAFNVSFCILKHADRSLIQLKALGVFAVESNAQSIDPSVWHTGCRVHTFESGILFFIKCLQNILEKQDVCVHTTNFHETNQINQINKDSVLWVNR